MNIVEATLQYETWLGAQTALVADDLALKHKQMASDVFPFMRATYYRWAQLFPAVCPDLAKAPAVLAVGDLHIENFGTWRDGEGRLIWGVNDFDEAHVMPYANDLVRMAVSAKLAIDASSLKLPVVDACDAILKGYTDGLSKGGKPYVLAEEHGWLRAIALGTLRDPERFWGSIDKLPNVGETVPPDAQAALEAMLPEPGLPYRVAHRQAGMGSLGRQRWLAIASWRGAKIAREAKPLLPSAYGWAQPAAGASGVYYEQIMSQAVRVPDPFTQQRDNWIVHRLAPDCSRIELASLVGTSDEAHLLSTMGREVANVHLGSRDRVAAVQSDLRARPAGWLHEAAKQMAKATTDDWEEWKKKT